MNQGLIMDLAKSALWTVVIVSGPVLVLGLITGLIISVFQAATSIQEQTLSFVPKLLAVFIAMIIFGPWMLTTMMNFMIDLYTHMNKYLV